MSSSDRNRYPRRSELRLDLRRSAQGKTILDTARFTAPFKITHPFPLADGGLEIMVLSVAAGIMAGDTQYIEVTVGSGAAARVTSQSYEKIHRMEAGGSARRETVLTVAADASLRYTPLPVLPFADSNFAGVTTINLVAATSRLFYSEILACGRAARGERFAYRSYRNRLRIAVANRLAYADNTVFTPTPAISVPAAMAAAGTAHEGSAPDNMADNVVDSMADGMAMEEFCLYEGYTHLLTVIITGVGATSGNTGASATTPENETAGATAIIAAIRAALADRKDVHAGVSLTAAGFICVKALSDRAETLLALENAIGALLS